MCYIPWSGRGFCLCRRNGLFHQASSLCPEWAWRTWHNHNSAADQLCTVRFWPGNLICTVAQLLIFYLIFWHKLVLGFLQNLHSPHWGMYKGMTVSPKSADNISYLCFYIKSISLSCQREKTIERTWLKLCDSLADTLHDAGSLVAQHYRKNSFRVGAT